MLRLVGRKETQKELSPLPQVVAENPEGYHSCKGPPLGVWSLNPTPGSPAQSTRAGRKAHIICGCENQWGFHLPSRDRSLLETQEPSSRASTKIWLAATKPGLQQSEGGLEETRVMQGKTVLCGSGERTADTAASFPVLSPSSTPPSDISFIESNIPLYISSAWRNATVPRSPCSAELMPCRGVSCLAPLYRGLDRLRRCQRLSCVALGWGPFTLLSHEPDQHFSLSGDPLALPSHSQQSNPAKLWNSQGGPSRIQNRLSCVAVSQGPYFPCIPNR